MGRKRKDAEAEEQFSQATQASQMAIPEGEIEKFADELCRFVLLQEHTKKPIAKADLKQKVLPDRQDRTGKIMKQIIARANEKLMHIAGLELLPDAVAADEENDAEGGQPTQSQAQGSKAQPALKYLLVNKLQGAVTHSPNNADLIYLGFVEAVLQLIMRNQDERMSEEDLMGVWLPKLGLSGNQTLPQHSQKAEELVKRMVAEAYLKKGKMESGAFEYTVGPRALLTRCDANQFHETHVFNPGS